MDPEHNMDEACKQQGNVNKDWNKTNPSTSILNATVEISWLQCKENTLGKFDTHKILLKARWSRGKLIKPSCVNKWNGKNRNDTNLI